jgi:Ser/Thr protein kinase RdoA (MazF antagonist)
VVPRADDQEGIDPADRTVPVDAALAQSLRELESEVDAYLQHQSSAHLRALGEALARLDALTADSDAWIAGVTNTASWGVDPKGTVIGETGNFPIAEDVPSAELNAQMELVKAAKQAEQNDTPQAVRTLEQARAALDASRR